MVDPAYDDSDGSGHGRAIQGITRFIYQSHSRFGRSGATDCWWRQDSSARNIFLYIGTGFLHERGGGISHLWRAPANGLQELVVDFVGRRFGNRDRKSVV